MKTQLDLTLAAKDTAIKTMSAGSAFEANKIVSADFEALKINDRHFEKFSPMVFEFAYQFAALKALPLEPESPEKKTPLMES